MRRANGKTGLSYAGELSEPRMEALSEIDPGWVPEGWDVAWQRCYRLTRAHDYGQHTAYLVIYNITDKLLQLPTDGTPGAWPPYTELTGVRVYFIHVRVAPPTTASKAGKATRVTLT